MELRRVNLIPIAVLLAAGCGDSTNGGGDGLPDRATDIFSEAEIELYEEQGFVVHRGSDPPNIEGAYEMADSTITWDESGQSTGSDVATYEWTFFDQSDDELLVSYVVPNGGNQANGIGGLMAGSGDCFTVFSELARDENGCVYRRTLMLSGCKTDGGIDDFQLASHGRFTGESANGPTECLEKEDPHRLTEEQDGVIDLIPQ